MSLGGLLVNVAGGAAVGAAEGAVEQYERNEEKAAVDLKFQRQQTLEALRAKNNRENDQMQIDARAEENKLNRASNEKIAGMRQTAPKREYLNPAVTAKVDVLKSELSSILKGEMQTPETQERANQIRTEIDTLLGFKAGDLPEAGPQPISPQMMQQAEAYANDKVDRKAGLLSSDATDFAQFGGDREKARKFYIDEYLVTAGAKQSPMSVLEKQFGKR